MTRILAVDDDPVNLLVLTDTLVQAGYQVDERRGRGLDPAVRRA